MRGQTTARTKQQHTSWSNNNPTRSPCSAVVRVIVKSKHADATSSTVNPKLAADTFGTHHARGHADRGVFVQEKTQQSDCSTVHVRCEQVHVAGAELACTGVHHPHFLTLPRQRSFANLNSVWGEHHSDLKRSLQLTQAHEMRSPGCSPCLQHRPIQSPLGSQVAMAEVFGTPR